MDALRGEQNARADTEVGSHLGTSGGPLTGLAVAVLTYRRTHLLRHLLPQLIEQLVELESRFPGRFEARIVVVDNDPRASATPVVEQLGTERVHYVVEQTPGISAARNRALAETTEADLLVFIDDDETPCPGWLCHLVTTYDLYRPAGAVAGPVVSEPEVSPDPFVVHGGFFERSHRGRLVTGSTIERAATNNLLLDLVQVRSLNLWFDQRFSFSGGEDSEFTGRLHRAGIPMVWCAEAVVTDHLPAARLTKQYALDRTRALAGSTVRAELALRPSPTARSIYRIRTIGHEVVRFVVGMIREGLGLLTGSPKHVARGRRSTTRAAGALQAVAGHWARPYERAGNGDN